MTMSIFTVTIHTTATVTLLPSPRVSPPRIDNADTPKNSRLYPNAHGYGVAVWFGIASAILAAILILIYMAFLAYKAVKKSRERRYVALLPPFFSRLNI